jgi:hypothetical protein
MIRERRTIGTRAAFATAFLVSVAGIALAGGWSEWKEIGTVKDGHDDRLIFSTRWHQNPRAVGGGYCVDLRLKNGYDFRVTGELELEYSQKGKTKRGSSNGSFGPGQQKSLGIGFFDLDSPDVKPIRFKLADERVFEFSKTLSEIMRDRRGGGYKLEGSGVSEDVNYGDKTVAKAKGKFEGANCVGATFQAFVEAYLAATGRKSSDRWIDGFSVERFQKFKALWYSQTEVNDYHRGSPGALIDAGLAEPVKLDQLEKGDFIQYWYGDKTKDEGHSAIVMDTLKDAKGRVTRIYYWSAQERNVKPDDKNVKIDTAKGYGISYRNIERDDEGRLNGDVYEIHGARVTTVK